MTRLPESYLAPKSQPWGRVIEKSITDAQQDIALNARNTDINLKQLNSSVNLLGRQQTILASQQETIADQQATLQAQQDYLATFQTYQSSYPGYIFSGTLSGNVWTRVLDFTLSFTLSRTSVVQLQTNAESQIADSRQTTYPQAMAAVRASFSVSPGSTYYGNSNSTSVYLGSSGSIQLSTGFTVTPSVQRTLTLAAGTYTVTGFWDGYAYTAGSCGVGRAYITASVIG